MRSTILVLFTALCGVVHAAGGGPTIYLFFDKNPMPLKTYVNDTLIAMVGREDLVLNVAGPGRYVLEFKNVDVDDLRIIDIKDDGIVYYRFKRAFGIFREITFEEEIIDYGDITKGAEGGKAYTFKNSGDQPLVIKLVKPTCGCTIAEFPKEPIAPGASGIIKVGYDTKRVGAFNKTIEVHSNAVVNARKILRIKGRVLEQL